MTYPAARRRILQWFFAGAWAGFIFYLSSIPNLESGFAQDFILRKAAHMAVYFILAWLLLSALVSDKQNKKAGHLLGAAFIAFLYAVSDEYHQSFVPGRSGAPTDVLIDSVGIFAAIFAWRTRFIQKAFLNLRGLFFGR